MTLRALGSRPPALPLVLLGAGGHARVLLALARDAGHAVRGVCDPALAAEQVTRWEGLEVLGGDDALSLLRPDEIQVMLGVGQLSEGSLREQLFETWRARGYQFPVLIHRSAWVAPDAKLDAGVQIMAGAIIQPACQVGENSIINTRASIDHDCRIDKNVHVAPGATLCGSVDVRSSAFIGAGAVVIQGLRIGERAVVGAGVTVLRDLEPGLTIVGAVNRFK